MPGPNGGSAHLPDFTDLQAIEQRLIPALEEWVMEAERGSDDWTLRLTLLHVTASRLNGDRSIATVEAKLDQLLERLGGCCDA